MNLKYALLFIGVGLAITLTGTLVGALAVVYLGKTFGQIIAFSIGFAGVGCMSKIIKWMEK